MYAAFAWEQIPSCISQIHCINVHCIHVRSQPSLSSLSPLTTMTTVTIPDLPSELLMAIFLHLDPLSAIKCRAVCKGTCNCVPRKRFH